MTLHLTSSRASTSPRSSSDGLVGVLLVQSTRDPPSVLSTLQLYNVPSSGVRSFTFPSVVDMRMTVDRDPQMEWVMMYGTAEPDGRTNGDRGRL